jgi:hypothetical protein
VKSLGGGGTTSAPPGHLSSEIAAPAGVQNTQEEAKADSSIPQSPTNLEPEPGLDPMEEV